MTLNTKTILILAGALFLAYYFLFRKAPNKDGRVTVYDPDSEPDSQRAFKSSSRRSFSSSSKKR